MKTMAWITGIGVLCACAAELGYASPSNEWTRIWGSTNVDRGNACAVDGNGNVYVAGYSEGAFDGQTNTGGTDICLTKLSPGGGKLWTRILGSAGGDFGNACAVDGNGNVYVAGTTPGAFDGQTNAGCDDICLTKWTPDGTKLWTRIWGSATLGGDSGNACVVDGSGNVYVAGHTFGSFDDQINAGGSDLCLTKWASDGTKLWTRIWGSEGWDICTACAVDGGGNVYVAGATPACDICLTKWAPDGTKLWTRIWGSAGGDFGNACAVDGNGNVYVAGTTLGAFDGQTNVGGFDVCLTKWAPNGTKLWTRIWGSADWDYGNACAVDGHGNIYVAGRTIGSFGGQANAGLADLYLTKLSPGGGKFWTRIWGSANDDCGNACVVDGNGNVYVAGYTGGSFDGQTNVGGSDLCLTRWIVTDTVFSPRGDYNGDGKSDLAIFYPTTGKWYVRTIAGEALAFGYNWGYKDTIAVPGDYDGDGVSDFAVYDPFGDKWHIKSMKGGNVLAWAQAWGFRFAIPVSGDYDGDGSDDLAVYNRTTGNWYIRTIAGEALAFRRGWGFRGAIPVPGDYDDDGVSDLAVYDTSSGNWYIQSMSGGNVLAWAQQWGFRGAIPVSGDYDGDGSDDLAVYNRITGNWYIRTIAGEALAFRRGWGFRGAIPVPGDYDGDGVSDLAVYDTSSGKWYIQTMSRNVLVWAQTWGFPGAEPVNTSHYGHW